MKKNNFAVPHHVLISKPDELLRVKEEILAEFKNHQAAGEALCIAVDTEFVREHSFFPEIGLIQLATRSKSYLIDPVQLSKNDLGPFFDLMLDKDILKIMHAANSDQEVLYTSYGLVATPSFDTAVAGSLIGFGDSVGLAKLLKEVFRIH